MIKRLTLILALSFSTNLLANDIEHFEAALAVVSMPEGEKFEEMIQGIVNQQVASDPSIRPIRRALEIFYRETFQSDEFIHGIANIQMDLFSYEELLQIKEMMDLPIFKKYEEIMPTFMTRNMQLGQQVVALKQDRLKELINAEHERIEKLQELDQQMNLTGSEQ
ncbi:hypothetical protein [Pseudocolwellia agarivorans]|jgi:hypothetical protein|uniref:hypothetical protein n=1 Tax=Pseudocolwellia agarivorans TaxID=1911682 RepID=UPI003F8823C4